MFFKELHFTNIKNILVLEAGYLCWDKQCGSAIKLL